ncbi:hypothetical protein [Mycobacterium bourgelatii]|uniref:Uncharacterized protein n=1 Tax=Mycobacterium bourgelatii TaxID=1273442 RepID=A0A7I9YR39_MYCBU|nr:hypothetical protein [Mycobacterium bourgelatii]MCV6975105.1 hypothetical protein [Mycobacterium bourgelatii]GFG91017.1 hypothetical protein MBOU_30590 [Mycobacterium bourgelatii]
MSAAAPLSVDTAAYLAQTKGLMGLVEETRSNNQHLLSAAGNFEQANRGQMGTVAQSVLADLYSTATQNNQVLDSITTGLTTTHTQFDGQEATNASAVLNAGGTIYT